MSENNFRRENVTVRRFRPSKWWVDVVLFTRSSLFSCFSFTAIVYFEILRLKLGKGKVRERFMCMKVAQSHGKINLRSRFANTLNIKSRRKILRAAMTAQEWIVNVKFLRKLIENSIFHISFLVRRMFRESNFKLQNSSLLALILHITQQRSI